MSELAKAELTMDMRLEAPVLSRRHAVGSPSARSLLFTVLGELVLPTGGSAWTGALIEALSGLSVEAKTTRQAIMRTAADGWLQAERAGRRTCWHLTDAAADLLAEGAARIYGFSGSQSDWDGTWLIVLARVPEMDRSARHLINSRLSWAGLSALAPGTWIGARSDRLAEVRKTLQAAGVSDSQCFRATHEDGDARAMVRQAWDVEAIAGMYRQFVSDFAPARHPGSLLASHIELVHRWRRFPQVDPGIPRDLLPESWPGDDAAALFTARRAAWREPALLGWAELNRQTGRAENPAG